MRKNTTSACSKMAWKYRCRFCLPLEDAKHATNSFTVEAKHANLLGRLGTIYLVAWTESDGLPSHVCRSCKRRAFTVEKLHCRQLFILEHHFRFPYLTEGVQHGLSKRSFPGTDRHRSQLGCNDPRVSIMYGHETRTRLLKFPMPHKKVGCLRMRKQWIPGPVSGPGYEVKHWPAAVRCEGRHF